MRDINTGPFIECPYRKQRKMPTDYSIRTLGSIKAELKLKRQKRKVKEKARVKEERESRRTRRELNKALMEK